MTGDRPHGEPEKEGGEQGGGAVLPTDPIARARASLLRAAPCAVAVLIDVITDPLSGQRERVRAAAEILDRCGGGLSRNMVLDMVHEVKLVLPPGMAPACQLPIVPTGLLPDYPGDDEVEGGEEEE